MQKQLLLGILLFIFGWLCSSVYSDAFSTPEPLQEAVPIFHQDEQKAEGSDAFEALQESFDSLTVPFVQSRNRQSPQDWIAMEQIHVYNNRVVIDIKDPEWAIFTDTKSMDPLIDGTSNAIEVVPKSPDDVQVGDIVAYQSEYATGIITHRVVEIASDEQGWYARMKGDNNERMDPGKVRFEQIRRVVVAVIY